MVELLQACERTALARDEDVFFALPTPEPLFLPP
jgi:hypothetical protein